MWDSLLLTVQVAVNSSKLLGCARFGDCVKILLEMETILAALEVAEITGLVACAAGQEEKNNA